MFDVLMVIGMYDSKAVVCGRCIEDSTWKCVNDSAVQKTNLKNRSHDVVPIGFG